MAGAGAANGESYSLEEELEYYLALHDFDSNAANRLREASESIQRAVINRGPCTDVKNPSAVLLARIKVAGKGCSHPTTGGGKGSAAPAVAAAPPSNGNSSPAPPPAAVPLPKQEHSGKGPTPPPQPAPSAVDTSIVPWSGGGEAVPSDAGVDNNIWNGLMVAKGCLLALKGMKGSKKGGPGDGMVAPSPPWAADLANGNSASIPPPWHNMAT